MISLNFHRLRLVYNIYFDFNLKTAYVICYTNLAFVLFFRNNVTFTLPSYVSYFFKYSINAVFLLSQNNFSIMYIFFTDKINIILYSWNRIRDSPALWLSLTIQRMRYLWLSAEQIMKAEYTRALWLGLGHKIMQMLWKS